MASTCKLHASSPLKLYTISQVSAPLKSAAEKIYMILLTCIHGKLYLQTYYSITDILGKNKFIKQDMASLL